MYIVIQALFSLFLRNKGMSRNCRIAACDVRSRHCGPLPVWCWLHAGERVSLPADIGNSNLSGRLIRYGGNWKSGSCWHKWRWPVTGVVKPDFSWYENTYGTVVINPSFLWAASLTARERHLESGMKYSREVTVDKALPILYNWYVFSVFITLFYAQSRAFYSPGFVFFRFFV